MKIFIIIGQKYNTEYGYEEYSEPMKAFSNRDSAENYLEAHTEFHLNMYDEILIVRELEVND